MKKACCLIILISIVINAQTAFGCLDRLFIQDFTMTASGGEIRRESTAFEGFCMRMPRAELINGFGFILVASLNNMDVFHIPDSVLPPGYVALVYYDSQSIARLVMIFNDLP